MQVLAPVIVYDECYGEDDGDLLCANLSRKRLICILGYMMTASTIRTLDARFYKLSFWDDAEIFGYHKGMPKEWKDLDDIIPMPIGLPGTADPKDYARIECTTLNVTPESIFWAGHIKHTSTRWESWSVSKEMLEKLLEETDDSI